MNNLLNSYRALSNDYFSISLLGIMTKTLFVLFGIAALQSNAQISRSLELDVDYPGNDITGIPRPSANDCWSLCSATVNCKLFVWGRGTCWLKRSLSRRVQSPGAAAGIMPASCVVAENVDYYGNDIAQTRRTTPGECCQDCSATPNCNTYTWFNGVCFLKSSQSGRISYPGAMSGSLSSTPSTPTPTTTPATTQVPCTRTRKSWNVLTQTEKDLYNAAILVSMNNGAYAHFAAMHEYLFDQEIHQTCVFLFWHREFLLGFENMLRSLGPQYRCISIPYFDYVRDSVGFRARSCTNLYDCSSITRELGTSSAFSGRFNRANWRTTNMIVEMSHLSIQNYLLPQDSRGIGRISNDIELYIHNAVHNMLSNDLSARFSPRDPMFFSHHATVDLLHSIYYECQARGTTGNKVWENCNGRNGSPFISTTTAVNLMAARNVNSLTTDPMRAWYAGLPRVYAGYPDINALGSFSYSYELRSGPLSDMRRTCGVASRRRLTNTAAEGSSLILVDQATPVYDKERIWQQRMTQLCQTQGLNANETRIEMERILTLMYQNCFPGDVKDYSENFKKMMGIEGKKARGKVILEKIDSGELSIRLPKAEWTAINFDTYGCKGDEHVVL